MSDSETRSPDDLPLPIQREIDAVCQSFEAADAERASGASAGTARPARKRRRGIMVFPL